MISALKSALADKRLGSTLPTLLRTNLTPLLLLALAITAAVMLYQWRDQASYKPLFGAHEKVAASDLMGVLDAERIPYRLHPDSGQVLVPASALGKARMLLAAKGVTAQLPAGLELMDHNDPLGVSQFVQDVRFRRGLEGELAQSILALDAIASARVHLAIARSSSFVAGDGDKSSASVVVAVKPGRNLSHEQIAAIVNMVAGSVANLAPARVSLVDQGGNLLSARVDLADGFDPAGAADNPDKRIADGVRANVNELLGPVLGADNYKVSVTADIDNDKVEETQEKYGADPKVTSEAMREELEKNRVAMGVPGTLSNRPPQPDAAKPDDPSRPDDGSARKNASTRQFAYDRSITQVKKSRGRLRKLSVAVVLNDAAPNAPKGGWNGPELARIEQILRGGLGIDAARGDVLAVSGLRFPAAPAPAPWWQERDTVADASGWAAWALGLLLAWLALVRPLLRLLKQRFGAQPQAATAAALPRPAAGASAPASGGADRRPLPVVPLLENYELPPAGSAVDVMVDHLKVLAGKEPERVAEVVKQWVQKKHGRSEPQQQ